MVESELQAARVAIEKNGRDARGPPRITKSKREGYSSVD